jgi:hypothetical protein
MQSHTTPAISMSASRTTNVSPHAEQAKANEGSDIGGVGSIMARIQSAGLSAEQRRQLATLLLADGSQTASDDVNGTSAGVGPAKRKADDDSASDSASGRDSKKPNVRFAADDDSDMVIDDSAAAVHTHHSIIMPTKPKSKAVGPSYFDLIKAAILALKERGGSSRQVINKFVSAKKGAGFKSAVFNKALRTAVDAKKLVQAKGSYKLAAAAKKAAPKKKKAAPKKKATIAVAAKAAAAEMDCIDLSEDMDEEGSAMSATAATCTIKVKPDPSAQRYVKAEVKAKNAPLPAWAAVVSPSVSDQGSEDAARTGAARQAALQAARQEAAALRPQVRALKARKRWNNGDLARAIGDKGNGDKGNWQMVCTWQKNTATDSLALTTSKLRALLEREEAVEVEEVVVDLVVTICERTQEQQQQQQQQQQQPPVRPSGVAFQRIDCASGIRSNSCRAWTGNDTPVPETGYGAQKNRCRGDTEARLAGHLPLQLQLTEEGQSLGLPALHRACYGLQSVDGKHHYVNGYPHHYGYPVNTDSMTRARQAEILKFDGFHAMPTVGATALYHWLLMGWVYEVEHDATPECPQQRLSAFAVLEALRGLADPESNDFNDRCVHSIAVLPTHQPQQPQPQPGLLSLKLHVYFRKSLFGLSAHHTIQTMMRALTPAGRVAPVRQSPPSSNTLLPSPTPPNAGHAEYRYTLPSLMRMAESTGFATADRTLTAGYGSGKVPGLEVELRSYQAEALDWMLDRESCGTSREQTIPSSSPSSSSSATAPSSSSSSSTLVTGGSGSSSVGQNPAPLAGIGGLNGYFWEVREWADGGEYFYFPLCGQLMLARPPVTTGGLLAEEMGLGKTVEVIALIGTIHCTHTLCTTHYR